MRKITTDREGKEEINQENGRKITDDKKILAKRKKRKD